MARKLYVLAALFFLIFLSCLVPLSIASPKKKAPPSAARREDIQYIKCQVCEKIAQQIYNQVKGKESKISPKKISEYEVIEIAENVCNLKKAEADWILQIDIVEKGDKLELVEQGVEGQCNSECKTIERACQEDYDSFEEEITQPKKSQLEMYLEEQKIDRKVQLDILRFWKGNQYRYPEVAAMARDVLCIPISTVASESAFSNSGRVLDQYRSALKHDIVEALICTKDWLYGENVVNDADLESITEDIMNMNLSAEENRAEEDTSSVK